MSIAASGMRAAQLGVQVAARNIAHVAAPDAVRLQLQRSNVAEGGVQAQVMNGAADPAAPVADLLAARSELRAFTASAALIRRHDQMLGTLLDVRA